MPLSENQAGQRRHHDNDADSNVLRGSKVKARLDTRPSPVTT